MIITRQVLETINNYKHCSSKDETRPYLNSVAISLKGSSLVITATDGFKMISSTHEVENTDSVDTPRTIVIHNDENKKIDRLLKDNKYKKMFMLNIKGDLSVLVIDLTEIRLFDREYPNTSRYLDSKIKPVQCDSIAFNPMHLEDLRKAIAPTKTLARRLKPFKFILEGETQPMRCTAKFKGVEHKMILMPCK